MAIIIKTKDPQQLIVRINQYIDSNNIKTWSYDEEGDYTTVSSRGRFLAWMHPILPSKDNDIPSNYLYFSIIASTKYKMTKELYGVYHGRFIATLLSNFDTEIEEIRPTPLALEGIDRII